MRAAWLALTISLAAIVFWSGIWVYCVPTQGLLVILDGVALTRPRLAIGGELVRRLSAGHATGAEAERALFAVLGRRTEVVAASIRTITTGDRIFRFTYDAPLQLHSLPGLTLVETESEIRLDDQVLWDTIIEDGASLSIEYESLLRESIAISEAPVASYRASHELVNAKGKVVHRWHTELEVPCTFVE